MHLVQDARTGSFDMDLRFEIGPGSPRSAGDLDQDVISPLQRDVGGSGILRTR